MKLLFRRVALRIHPIKQLLLGYLYGDRLGDLFNRVSQTAATTLDVYRFADQNNVTAVGGFGPTIAWHGGWVMVRKLPS